MLGSRPASRIGPKSGYEGSWPQGCPSQVRPKRRKLPASFSENKKQIAGSEKPIAFEDGRGPRSALPGERRWPMVCCP